MTAVTGVELDGFCQSLRVLPRISVEVELHLATVSRTIEVIGLEITLF